MSLTATAHSIPGTLRQEIIIDGCHRLVTDEPERLGGEGSAPAPHELLPAAIASCISTTLVRFPTAFGLPLLRESRVNHLGKLAFQWLYWHALLPGRDLPGIGPTMPTSGKRMPAAHV